MEFKRAGEPKAYERKNTVELIPRDQLAMVGDRIAQMEKEQKIAKRELDKIKEQLLKSMDEYEITKWETIEGALITRVKDTEDKVVKKFDLAAFEKDHPKLYAEYMRDCVQSGRSGFIKITI